MSGFVEFPKMARLRRDCIVTEKIDGTNAQVFIATQADVEVWPMDRSKAIASDEASGLLMFAGSRSRWIQPSDDNFGFAAWAQANAVELFGLGPGRHFGEWWGSGIQRGYGLPKGEKRFSLFNVSRWAAHGTEPQPIQSVDPRQFKAGADGVKLQDVAPACCSIVPVLMRGPFATTTIEVCVEHLAAHGSMAAPGFMNPEGVVVFHVAGNFGLKRTIEKDEEPKSKTAAA
jgi:hypothetical protein